MKQEDESNELPQPCDERSVPIEAAEGDMTEQTGESPTTEEINNTSMEETINASVTAAQESSRADESTQEIAITDAPVTQELVKDEPPTIVQESPTKEETPSDMQEESREEPVDGLSVSTNMGEHISELPTLQEEITAQDLQEFTAVITSK